MASEHPTENSQTTEGAAGVEQDLGAVLTGQNTPSFIARLGREAETALGSILDLAGRLRDASSDIDAVTTKIQGRGETLRRTFRSLRHLARLSDEDGAPDSEEVDAVALAQDCPDELDSAARRTGLELALEAPPSPVEIPPTAAPPPPAHRPPQRHQLSPGSSPGNWSFGRGVIRSFPLFRLNVRNASVITAHTSWRLTSAGWLPQQPSRS